MSDTLEYRIVMDVTNDTPQSFQRVRRYIIADPVGGDFARSTTEDVTPEAMATVFDHAAIAMNAQVQSLSAQIARERAEAAADKAAALAALDAQWQARWDELQAQIEPHPEAA